jgi:hypothetical protein
MSGAANMRISRRFFLRGMIAAPFVVKAEWLMPVKPQPIPYLAGDLIRWRSGVIAPDTCSLMLCAEPVVRVERDGVVVAPGFGSGRREHKVAAHLIDLFHGLPGNRVNNPSVRHRLVPGLYGGLAYPEDLAA